MDHQLYVAILSILVISIIFYIKSILTNTTPPLPPGPRGLPILGYLPFLGHNLLEKFTHLSHKHGPIFKFHLGNKLCVVIASPSLAKQIVRKHDAVFASRDVPIAARIASYGASDIAWSQPNPEWRSLRKIFGQELMSSRSLEASYALRTDEVRQAVRRVYSKTGEVVEIGRLIFRTELNAVMSMLWGGTIGDEGESERIAAEFCDVLKKIVDLFLKPNVSDFYPVLARFDIQGIEKEMQRYMRSVDLIFDDLILKQRKKMTQNVKKQGKKDLLQVLLECHQRQDSETSITLTQLKAILMDVVTGGTDSTATTAEWAMAELMNNPNVMIKAQNELSDVVGLNNSVEESHMPKLEYLQAVIKETLRLHPAVPLLVPKSPSEPSVVGGYMIPTNTRVLVNVWSIQRDPSIWDDPMVFRPERFLDHEKNGKWDYKGNNFDYLPFGSGRRMCPGLPLAERMLIYLLASLLHCFDWKLAQGDQALDMEETFGIVLRKTTPLFAIPNPRLSNSNLYL